MEPRAATEIRRALPIEERRAAELLYAAPSAEAAGVAGGAKRAAALGMRLFLAGAGRSEGDDVLLALRAGRAVGALLGRAGRGSLPGTPSGALRTLAVVLRVYPPWALPGLARRARLRSRLEFPVEAGCYHVAELQVEPAERGSGAGSLLLARADDLARERGCGRIRLSTSLVNPALRLYARHGYQVLERRTVAGYQALTGTPGRALLEKRL